MGVRDGEILLPAGVRRPLRCDGKRIHFSAPKVFKIHFLLHFLLVMNLSAQKNKVLLFSSQPAQLSFING